MFTNIQKQKLILAVTVLFVSGLISSDAWCWAKNLPNSKKTKERADEIDASAPNNEPYFDLDEAATAHKAVEEAGGSLWVDNYSSRIYDNMYRASRVGDTVTIVVDERATGFNKGDTKTNKKTEHTSSIDYLGNIMNKLMGFLPGLDPSQLIKAKTESKFTGDGSTNRSGELNAKLTATVTRVLRNGNLVLRGEQRLKINKEDQILVVEGIIRPFDIMPDNTIKSSSLADARISFSGFGVVAERQSPGWMVRALDYVWPF